MRAVQIAIAALALGGCSGAGLEPVPRAEAQDSPESYYQLLVSSSVAVRPLRGKPGTSLQISALRRSVAPQPGDWMTCLRVQETGKRDRFTALFIRNREVVDYRSGVAIDRCEGESYSPFTLN